MKTVTIEEISNLVSKGTTPTSVGLSFSVQGIPFLRGEDIVATSVNPLNSTMFISKESHDILHRSKIIHNDVLITIAGTIGRVGVVDYKTCDANCNQAVAIVRTKKERTDAIWLGLLLRSPSYQKQFKDFIAGGGIPNVSLTQVRSIVIPDIPLKNQKQIAAKTKNQLDKIDKAIIATRIQNDELLNLSNSIIYDSIKSIGTRKVMLGEVLDEIKKGIGSEWIEYPVLGVTRAGLAPAREPVGKSPQKYKPAIPGTIFYNPMRILIGSIAFVDNDDSSGITSPDYVVLKGKEGIVNSRWFYHWLRSPYGEKCINSLARGAVRERMLFNRLAEGQIDLPDFQTQERAAEALAKIKSMRKAIEKQLKGLELMPQKLLSQIFEN